MDERGGRCQKDVNPRTRPPGGAGVTLKYSNNDAPGTQAVHLASPPTSALEDGRGVGDEKKKNVSLQGPSPSFSPTLLTAQWGGGG